MRLRLVGLLVLPLVACTSEAGEPAAEVAGFPSDHYYEDAIARFKSLVEQCEEQDGVSDIAARAHNQIADMYFWNLRQENRAYEHYAAAFERSGDGNDAERSTRIFAMTGLALVAAAEEDTRTIPQLEADLSSAGLTW